LDALSLLDRAFATDPQPDRAEALLREALGLEVDRASVGAALAHLARVTGNDRMLIDGLVVLSELDLDATNAAERLQPLEEAVGMAERLGDGALAEELLRKAVARSAIHGDAPLGWALSALAAHRTAAGDLASAADLLERAARAGGPERERTLLLGVAGMV